jgi:hypothetical protein
MAPYSLVAVPADDPCGDVLYNFSRLFVRTPGSLIPFSVDLGDHTGLSMTWNNVSLSANTRVMFYMEDSVGNDAWSGAVSLCVSLSEICELIATWHTGHCPA